jgi:hypothetical protein
MNIRFPSFTSSDPELNATYDYRCALYQRHVKETPAGHVITEFLPLVGWSGIYNTISCAASHHFRDGRWMQDPTPLCEYANFWCTEGNPRLYSFPISDSLLALENVTGDRALAKGLYPAGGEDFVANIPAILLQAISLGAVFFGAMTYIGNGPNFMVKAIAEENGIKMPSFFGYMLKFSLVVLLPVYILVQLIFL